MSFILTAKRPFAYFACRSAPNLAILSLPPLACRRVRPQVSTQRVTKGDTCRAASDSSLRLGHRIEPNPR